MLSCATSTHENTMSQCQIVRPSKWGVTWPFNINLRNFEKNWKNCSLAPPWRRIVFILAPFDSAECQLHFDMSHDHIWKFQKKKFSKKKFFKNFFSKILKIFRISDLDRRTINFSEIGFDKADNGLWRFIREGTGS